MKRNSTEQKTTKQKKKRVCAFFKRAWRAIKRTFSCCIQNNDVVSISILPDLDPSDPEPGPSHLEPRFFPIPPDFLPGSCNWEQECLEDLDDPQSDPPDLEPCAPQDPIDHQPGPSGLDPSAPEDEVNTKSGTSSDLKPPAPQVPVCPEIDGLFPVLYEVKQQLGGGSFGNVYQGIRRSDQQMVAIKFIRKIEYFDRYFDFDEYSEPLFKEVALNLLVQKPDKCPNIVELLDWFDKPQWHVMVLEFPHPCVTLLEFIKNHGGRLDEMLARVIMRQAIIAAKHCIEHFVFHHDIHAGNILVNTETLEVKLIDFGSGILVTSSREQIYAEAETVLSLGFVLYITVTGEQPYTTYGGTAPGNQEIHSLGLSDEFLDLANRCRSLNPAVRPTLEQILDHEWFKQGHLHEVSNPKANGS